MGNNHTLKEKTVNVNDPEVGLKEASQSGILLSDKHLDDFQKMFNLALENAGDNTFNVSHTTGIFQTKIEYKSPLAPRYPLTTKKEIKKPIPSESSKVQDSLVLGQAIVAEYPDYLKMTENNSLHFIATKKQLKDLYAGLADRLKKAGWSYVKWEAENPFTKGWRLVK